MSKELPFTVYIGYDPREQTAYDVCKFAIERTASKAVRIIPIKRPTVERMGLYYRQFDIVDDQFIDLKDGRPFSHFIEKWIEKNSRYYSRRRNI